MDDWLKPLERELYQRRLSSDKTWCERCGHGVKPVDQCECVINDVLLEEYPKRIEELESLTDWRDVTKELPKENGRYLCRTVNDGYVALEFKAAVATLHGDYGSVWHDNVENYTHAVTHWRPLVPVEADQQPDGGCDEDA